MLLSNVSKSTKHWDTFLSHCKSHDVDISQKSIPMNQEGQIAQWLEHLVYIQKVLGSIPSLAISLSHPVCHLYIRACSVLCLLSLSPCVRSLWCFHNMVEDSEADSFTGMVSPKRKAEEETPVFAWKMPLPMMSRVFPLMETVKW